MPAADDVLNNAIHLHEAGDSRAAEMLYRQLISAFPEDARVWRLLGVLICQRDSLNDGLELLRQAVLLAPNNASCRNSLGEALRAAGKLADAKIAFEQAVSLDQNHAHGCFNLGSVLLDSDTPDRAEFFLRRALQLRPDWADAHHNLGFLFANQGRREEAIAEYRKALTIRPESAETLNNLGTVLFQVGAGDIGSAIDCYQRALQLSPTHRNALLNLGNALATTGRNNEAIALFTRLLELEPHHPNAHFNRAVLQLKLGNFAEGWPEYEWRTTQTGITPRSFHVPHWDGSPLGGRAILLHAEQGLGDTMQFVRYAPLVQQRGGRVIVECQLAVRRLLETAPGIDALITRGETIPEVDWEAPLMSLPGILGTTLESIPGDVPYLHAEPVRVEHWQRLLATDNARLRIGIAWQGSATNREDQFRSIRLIEFEPLVRIDGVRLYALQKGPGSEQIDALLGDWPLVDLRAQLDVDVPFADTAALMQCLDLIVTSDTSLAHLAGALGRPVWVALQADSDYRWLLERNDSPWYPTMRLFRQRNRGEWSPVFAEMAATARELNR